MADRLITERLVSDIGGILCEVCLQPPLSSAALMARYAAFLTTAVPDWQIELCLRSSVDR